MVITGTGVICSLGRNPSEVWEALLSRRTGIKPIEGFDAGGFGCIWGAQVKGLNPLDLGIHPRDLRIMNTHSYLLMKGARDAFVESGLGEPSIPREEIGFFAALGMVDYRVEDLIPALSKSQKTEGGPDYPGFHSKGYSEIYPLWPLSMLNNISFCQVATSLDIQGENTVLSPHADSGAMVVAEGMKCLVDRRAQAVLCAGVSEKVNPFSLARAQLCGVLNTTHRQNGPPCRPFDRERRGTVLGEGCGAIALELESSARRRGIPYVASMAGYGSKCETEGGCSGPTAKALSLAMRDALDRAGLGPSEIDLVIAHGDGTVVGDRHEAEAIHDVFSSCLDRLMVYSSKGAIGHLQAGGPLVDLILGVSMLRNNLVPPISTTSSPDPTLRFRLVLGEPMRKTLKRILITCQSYEGQAASLILEAIGGREGR